MDIEVKGDTEKLEGWQDPEEFAPEAPAKRNRVPGRRGITGRRGTIWKIVVGVIVLGAVITMINLGLWQWSRHNEKVRLNDRVEMRMEMSAVSAEDLLTRTAISDFEFRKVSEIGRFDCESEVLIRNRTRNGRPGFWVFTPFVVFAEDWESEFLEAEELSGTVMARQAYIVNRGWLPLAVIDRYLSEKTADNPAEELGQLSEFAPPPLSPPNPCNTTGVAITGFVRLPVNGEGKECESYAPVCTFAQPDTAALAIHFASETSNQADISRPNLQNINPGLYIQQDFSEPPPDEIPLFLTDPSFSTGNHRSYAFQWFIFATIAAVGYPLILRRAAHKKKSASRK